MSSTSEPLIVKDENASKRPSALIDHLGFVVHPSKLEEVTRFYVAALAPLGIAKQQDIPGIAVGFGPEKTYTPFWIAGKEDGKSTGTHIAFSAKDHETVDQFHAEALKVGGTCNGKPGVRKYHPNYYAAFVIDPVG